MKEEQTNLAIYQSDDGEIQVTITLENETLWLPQKKIAELFGVDVRTINDHIQNIYKSSELTENWTIRKNRIVQKEWKRKVSREVFFYNLDIIIAVGYRVNSTKATQFRIRATNILKDYLIKGYALNHKRLEETKLDELQQVVALIKKNIAHAELSHQETTWLLNVITHYTHSWILLQQYDEGSLIFPDGNYKLTAEITYQEAIKSINDMRTNFLFQNYVSELFGIERNNEFKWILESIYQKFDGQELYPTVEEKAAHLLFFIVKNHPFADGNKKIWAFLFLRFLAKNNCLYNADGSKKIDDHTVVAITLLVATCDMNQKNMIIRLILNFLAKQE
ncbi:MAG: hypothetical protein ACD_80C00040G0002 [uncultured bacterium (gcode 4)]|uniref:Fido domain-containing protein n=1 Tax=uncultured bacterium (gcode 4) TaxID=1234023 RepID=K1X5M7_9BACT|nr:MAG: hypothetical protein ACD_80C00040G0002 [uncultured bacterium (gcode 4)]